MPVRFTGGRHPAPFIEVKAVVSHQHDAGSPNDSLMHVGRIPIALRYRGTVRR